MGWRNSSGWEQKNGWYRPPVVSSPPTTFDPSKKGTNLTLSGGNLTVTATGSTATVLTIASHSSGKFYFEMTDGADVGGTSAGIANISQGVNSYLGDATNNSIQIGHGGAIFLNNASIGSAGFIYSTTDVLSVAIDMGAKKIWVRKNGGSWDSTTDDPATGVGGFSYSTMNAGPYFAGATTASSGDAATFNFGATAYAYTPPSGFGNW